MHSSQTSSPDTIGLGIGVIGGVALLGRLALAVGVLTFVGGCGGGGDSPSSGGAGQRTYVASAVRACLEQAGASVSDNDPAFVAGDTSRGTFQVGVDGDYADVAFGASEESAAETEEEAQGMLNAFGDDGDHAFHRGNVAYWQLDDSDAPIKALEQCL